MELTPVQEKLAEVLGLARAAPVALARVADRADDPELGAMRREAEQVQQRCADIAAMWGDVVWDVLSHAATVERKAGELVAAWVKAGTDTIDRYAFLAMAETGELAATAALGVLGSGDATIEELVEWALPLQERHLAHALGGCTRAAAATANAVESVA